MGKLFRLREWLTVEETAKHLSSVFREEVSEADVLRLALDGHLTLSVNFVNLARARRGKIVPIENARLIELPPVTDGGGKVFTYNGINIDGKRILVEEKGIMILDGVYDLPMIGGEKLDVEHEYQRLTRGPEVRLSNLEGAFVQEDELTLYHLQESFDDNEYQPGSHAPPCVPVWGGQTAWPQSHRYGLPSRRIDTCCEASGSCANWASSIIAQPSTAESFASSVKGRPVQTVAIGARESLEDRSSVSV